MKKTQCIKCGSGNTYQQDGENACMMCGSRWPIARPLVPPYPIAEDLRKRGSYSKDNKSKSCVNCGRNRWIAVDGLCDYCYKAALPFPRGSVEREDALAKAKKKVLNPSFGRHSRQRKAVIVSVSPKESTVIKEVSPIKKAMDHINQAMEILSEL